MLVMGGCFERGGGGTRGKETSSFGLPRYQCAAFLRLTTEVDFFPRSDNCLNWHRSLAMSFTARFPPPMSASAAAQPPSPYSVDSSSGSNLNGHTDKALADADVHDIAFRWRARDLLGDSYRPLSVCPPAPDIRSQYFLIRAELLSKDARQRTAKTMEDELRIVLDELVSTREELKTVRDHLEIAGKDKEVAQSNLLKERERREQLERAESERTAAAAASIPPANTETAKSSTPAASPSQHPHRTHAAPPPSPPAAAAVRRAYSPVRAARQATDATPAERARSPLRPTASSIARATARAATPPRRVDSPSRMIS